MSVFYFLLDVSVTLIDHHQVEKYRNKRKSAREGASSVAHKLRLDGVTIHTAY